MKQRLAWLVLLAALLGAALAPRLLRSGRGNGGYVALNRALAAAAPAEAAAQLATAALALDAGQAAGDSGWRGRMQVRRAQGDVAGAAAAWRRSGYTLDALLQFSMLARQQGDAARMVSWLQMAEAADPTSPAVWRLVGRVCQVDTAVGPICDRFLAQNDQNWLVNPAFDDAAWGWQQRTGSPAGGVVPCPARDGQLCGRGEGTAQAGGGWFQCLQLAAGRSYRFTAWVRVEAAADVAWRPLYVQGAENGRARGIWPGDRRGSSAWSRWEQTFVAPAFDDQTACLYPVLLPESGQFWFYAPAFVMLPPS